MSRMQRTSKRFNNADWEVTVLALTGEFTTSGHGVLATLGKGGAPRTVGRIGFGE